MDASEFFYRRCQELCVPLIVLTRHAAYACPVSKRVYDSMKQTNSPIGARLHKAQKTSIVNLWRRAIAPVGDAARMGLPPRCDKTWFCNTFCAGVQVAGEDCWPYIVSFNMYVCVLAGVACESTGCFA